MTHKKIRGRIIRIVDPREVVINLGSTDGIDQDSIFLILGEEEIIIDPETETELGRVSVVKGRVKAKTVDDHYTITSTRWKVNTIDVVGPLAEALGEAAEAIASTKYPALLSELSKSRETPVDTGDLDVNEQDLQPWKALKETPVAVGDEVEVTIFMPEHGD